MSGYDFNTIEAKWQKIWLANNIFAAPENPSSNKRYVLDMFPYPSGDGLHVGHVKIYTASDVVARFLRLRGFNVLHPTGWDAFGLPTENSAIKFKIHPAELTRRNTDRFRGQMQRLGFSYDWSREINTTDPNYYQWTQWIFLQLFKHNLAYQATVPINWCPSCKTGLANEEVTGDGNCERCGAAVEQKPMKQWMMRITQYAEQLLSGLAGLNWPVSILEMQRNWIGRKEGINIVYQIKDSKENITCFTTRPDTNFGATFVVIAPEHPLAQTWSAENTAVAAYVKQTTQKTERDRLAEGREKTGVFTGHYAINTLTGHDMPIWVSDFVVGHFGTGAVVGVPGHDQRDFEFARKFQLPIIRVVVANDSDDSPITQIEQVQEKSGTMINSGFLDGLDIHAATEKIMAYMEQQGYGRHTVTYSLRDWVFSRQHYWGEPIPIIHCKKCGAVPVPEDELPVVLPPVEQYEPTGTGESPLAAVANWVNTKCPVCSGSAQRETDTMPNWAGSSWYFLRFTDPHNQQVFAAKEKMQSWLPVDMYIGGAEHAVLHLLYARFWQKALSDMGLVTNSEPFDHFYGVGLVMGEDGQKMSKSRGNVVNPDDVVGQYGADTLRVYEMFMGPFEAAVAWDTSAIAGSHRFLKRIWNLFQKVPPNPKNNPFSLNREKAGMRVNQTQNTPHLSTLSSRSKGPTLSSDEKAVNLKLQQTIQRVTEGIESFRFNTAIAALMELLNTLEKTSSMSKQTAVNYILMLAPFAPHLAEELWQQIGHSKSIWLNPVWPQLDENVLTSAKIVLPVQVNGRLRGELTVVPGLTAQETKDLAAKLPNVGRHLAGKTIKRVVHVPDKMINFVVE